MTLKKLYKSIVISPLHDGRRYELKKATQYAFKSFWEPFNVYIGNERNHPFIFDWASVPRLLWFFWSPMWTDTLPGALFHDYLYRKQYCTREQADQCFNELMIYCKVWFIKRNMFYLWVRIFWWIAWRKNKTLQNNKKH